MATTPKQFDSTGRIDWETLRERIFSFAGAGYFFSFLVHAVVLVVMSFIVVQGMVGDEPITTMLSESEDEEFIFDEAIETKLDAGSAPSQELTVPEFESEPFELSEISLPDPELELSLDVIGKGTGELAGNSNGAETSQSFEVPVSGNAVTKGSFTVWTVPKDPLPMQDYLIVVQIDLPKKVRKYYSADLSGLVTGTDGYRKQLPGGPNRQLTVRQHKSQIYVPIPGARSLVRDRIEVASDLLNERQSIEIVF